VRQCRKLEAFGGHGGHADGRVPTVRRRGELQPWLTTA
jgi:hypothetical protein